MNGSIPLYKRLEFPLERIDARASITTAEKVKRLHPSPAETFAHKLDLFYYQSRAAVACYLEENMAGCVKWAREVVTAVQDLFFGEWREKVPDRNGRLYPASHWLESPWVQQYRIGLLWASSLDEWRAVKQVSRYPSLSTIDHISERRSESQWYLMLASYLRGEQVTSDAAPVAIDNGSEPKEMSYEEAIQKGRSKRLKLLSDVLKAMSCVDQRGTQRAIEQYLVYYRKSEFPRDVIEDKVSVDGSILVHVADRRGMSVTIPREYVDHIVRLPLTSQ